MQLANCIRFLAIDAVQQANSGHPGMPMGMADIATVLFKEHLKFDPSDPLWKDRDRLIISNGHGSMLLYAALYLTGYKDISLEDLKKVEPKLTNDVLKVFDLTYSVNSKKSYGGTSFDNIKKMIIKYKKQK